MNKKYKNLKILFFKRTMLMSMNTYLVYFLLMILFILSFFFINSYRMENTNIWISNIDSTSIHMSVENIIDDKEEYYKVGWSKDDINRILNVEHVTDVVPFEEHSTFIVDTKGNFLEDKFEYNGKEIPISFETVKVPKEIYKNYGYYKPIILEGEYPEDDTDDLLIPDILAYTLSDDIKSLVGANIDLEVVNDKNEKAISSYTISGIYGTDVSNIQETYTLYTGNNLNYYDLYTPDEKGYKFYKEDFESDVTYEEYLKNIGIGLPDLLIEVDSSKNIQNVQEKLMELYPDYSLESQFNYMHGIFNEKFRKINRITFVYYSIAVLIFMVMNYFLFKEYIEKRRKEFLINYSLGYPKSKLILVIAFEFILKNILLFLLFIILASIIVVMIDVDFITNNVFSLSNIIYSFIFIILSNILNIISIIKILKGNRNYNVKQ